MQRAPKLVLYGTRLAPRCRSIGTVARLSEVQPPSLRSILALTRPSITQAFISRVVPTPFVLPARSYSSSNVTEDDEREGLFYHTLDGGIYALSFLRDKPGSRNSATVIGLVPEGQGLDRFEENQTFVDLLHETVKSALTNNVDPDLANDATQRQEGWMHVHDLRRFPESGRTGDADDIIGTVLVQQGRIKGETYERMPMYRICTIDGPIKLSSSMHERLLSALKDAHSKESRS